MLKYEELSSIEWFAVADYLWSTLEYELKLAEDSARLNARQLGQMTESGKEDKEMALKLTMEVTGCVERAKCLRRIRRETEEYISELKDKNYAESWKKVLGDGE